MREKGEEIFIQTNYYYFAIVFWWLMFNPDQKIKNKSLPFWLFLQKKCIHDTRHIHRQTDTNTYGYDNRYWIDLSETRKKSKETKMGKQNVRIVKYDIVFFLFLLSLLFYVHAGSIPSFNSNNFSRVIQYGYTLRIWTNNDPTNKKKHPFIH